MQIFLSHSSLDGAQAEAVHLALEELGHEVFFDRSSLPTGESFNDKIREAIAECEVFVFLVSRNSLREGSYCLTELKFIAERWKHPRGRVLPVMLEPLAARELPPYLRAVTFLEPRGSVAAETAQAVSRLLARYQRRRAAWIAASVALAALATAGVIYQRSGKSEVPLEARELALTRVARQLGDGGDVCELSVLLANDASRPRTLTRAAIELEPKEFAVRIAPVEGTTADAAAAPAEVLELERRFEPGDAKRMRWLASPRIAADGSGALETELANARWRFVWRWHDGEESRTEWMAWQPSGELANRALVPLARELRHRARRVEARDSGGSFLLALANDGAIVELPASGAPIERALLGAEPVALDENEGIVAVATLAPESLSLFDAQSWSRSGPHALLVREIPPERGGGHFSTQPRELAVWKGDVWIRTGEPDRPAQLVQFIPEHDYDRTPYRTYYDYDLVQELSEPTRDVRFAVVEDRLWGAGVGSGLAQICSFWQGDLVLYLGNPDEGLAGARDLAEGAGGTFLTLDLVGRLIQLAFEEHAFRVERTLGKLEFPEVTPNPWFDYRIDARGERVLVGATLHEETPPNFHPIVARIATWEPRAGLTVLAALPEWEVVSVATQPERGIAVLRHASGRYDAVEIPFAR